MKSYASIDRIESQYAICEVELIPIELSKSEDFAKKHTRMLEVSLQKLYKRVKNISEGDILIAEHDGEKINYIYCKDDDEKNRRCTILNAI